MFDQILLNNQKKQCSFVTHGHSPLGLYALTFLSPTYALGFVQEEKQVPFSCSHWLTIRQ